MLIFSNTKKSFKWIQWVMSENQGLVSVVKPLVHKHTMGNLIHISVETFKTQMLKVVQDIELDLAVKFLKKFGIVFDGWSKFAIHYVAVFAVGTNVPDGKVLLSISPFEDEANLTAEQHGLYLSQQLQYFKWFMIDVIYLEGDNCSVNKKLSSNLGIFLVGCNSHKLNLAIRMFLALNFADKNIAAANAIKVQLSCHILIKLLSTLMLKMKAIKGKAQLCEYIDFAQSR